MLTLSDAKPSRSQGGRASSLVVAIHLGILLLASGVGCATSPGSPDNAVISYLRAVREGRYQDASAMVCTAAISAGRTKPFRFEEVPNYNEDDLADRGGYFGTGVTDVEGGAATVFGEFAVPTDAGYDVEPWAFELEKDGKAWKVCEVRPATEFEELRIADERTYPPYNP